MELFINQNQRLKEIITTIMKSLNKTFLPNEIYKNRNWYLVDCTNQKLGRLATVIANILKGKIKSHYYPSIDTGDYVILINTDSIKINKSSKHFLVFNPGNPGRSLKIRNAQDSLSKFTVEHAIRGMLAKTEKKRLMKRVKVYNNQFHPHEAQKPILLNISKV